ncbi:PilZ domain-containing protein [Halopseudomonas pachastrellae]|uniref:PilZ domain-containing protein n=1 Tax=Halopseudomonas pachastrellae TaxID=254161 RepID=UPI003D7C7D72|tara:strand:- start:1004 stop:1303 length:300 start_codon:yes stop_codon:yes gene_type:complete
MSFHDQQYSEKRDFMRMTMDATARLSAGDQQLDVLCRDLSNQGALVISEQAVNEGTPVTLTISSPTPGLQGLQAEGEVVRCQPENDGRFSLGLRFDSLN